jgi:hypothetical protein
VVRVALGIEQREQAQPRVAVRNVLVPLAPFVLDDLTLIVQGLLGERRHQPAHPVGLQPQRQLEVLRRHCLEVVRPVRVRGRVQRAAVTLHEPHVLGLGDVHRTLEHEVLEEVREAGLPGRLMPGTHVVPEVDTDDRRGAVLAHDDAQAVVQAGGGDGPRIAGRGDRRGLGRHRTKLSSRRLPSGRMACWARAGRRTGERSPDHPGCRVVLAVLPVQRSRRPGRQHHRLAGRAVLGPGRIGGVTAGAASAGDRTAGRPAGPGRSHRCRVRASLAAAQS